MENRYGCEQSDRKRITYSMVAWLVKGQEMEILRSDESVKAVILFFIIKSSNFRREP